jgi:hypothetical protein
MKGLDASSPAEFPSMEPWVASAREYLVKLIINCNTLVGNSIDGTVASVDAAAQASTTTSARMRAFFRIHRGKRKRGDEERVSSD